MSAQTLGLLAGALVAPSPLPSREDLRCAIAQKLGGPEAKAIADAIEKLVISTAREAALALTPDVLDPLVKVVFDQLAPRIEAELDKRIEQLVRDAVAKACAPAAPVTAED